MENPCSNCDSTSMEMCLLIRHCEHFVTKKPKEESRCREYVGVTCVNGGCPNAMADEYPEYGYENIVPVRSADTIRAVRIVP